jgi:shikimate dehydrogenase
VTRSYLVGLIGDAIGPSLSPLMHEHMADELGLRYLYRLIDIGVLGRAPESAGELARNAVDYGFTGLNVTFPCKQLVMPALDEIDEDASRIGAVNTIVIQDGRLIGHNTDWTGFRGAVQSELEGVRMDSVVQLGTGGAGAATAYALLKLGVHYLQLSDVDAARLGERVQTLRELFPNADITGLSPDEVPQALAAADGLVNATPIGMHGRGGAPVDTAALEPRHWVADVIYRPVRTRLIDEAARLGCRVMGGGAMAVGQAIDSFELFTGIRPERADVTAFFAQLVAAEAAE